MDNIYNNPILFRIYDHQNTVYTIKEPIGWDKVTLHIERDADYYGFIANYLSGEEAIKFGNDDEICFNLLTSLYDQFRGEALAYFEVVYIDENNNEQRLFRLKLNFNYYVYDGVYISLQVEEIDFTTLLRTRYESEISMEDTVNIDGLPVPSFSKQEISLHSREIYRKLFIETKSPREANINANRYAFLLFDSTETSDEADSDLSGNQSTFISFSSNDYVPSTPFFVCPEDGVYTIRFQTFFAMLTRALPNAAMPGPYYIRGYSVQPRLTIVRNGNEIILDNYYDKVEREPVNQASDDWQFNSGIQVITGISLLAGDRIIIQNVMDSVPFVNVQGTQFNVYNYHNNCYIEAGTTAPPTTANGYKAINVLRKLISWYTGVNSSDLVESAFMNTGGCGNHYHILNGFQIRNFSEDRPIKTSLKDFVESICPIFGLGYSIVERGSGNRFLIEPVAYFFKKDEDNLILSIQELTSYEEIHANNLIYNEVEFGYETYPTEGERALDEFNTVQKYLLPIKYYKNKFSKISKYIAAGYTLEEQRRKQFETTELDSAPNDDNIFIVNTIDESPTKAIAQRLGGFVRVDGIYSPNTVYNLRISPKRIMLNWTNILSTMLMKKPLTDVIKNTEAKNNNKAVSKIFHVEEFDACDRFEEPFVELKEGGDMVVSDFQQPLFDCILCKIECVISFDEAIRIRKCLMATDINEDANFGFIEFPNDKGEATRGFIKTFEYELYSNVAKIEAYKIIS